MVCDDLYCQIQGEMMFFCFKEKRYTRVNEHSNGKWTI